MIPLVVTSLLPLLPHLVKGVEKAFGGKKGTEKKTAVVNLAADLVSSLKDSGLIGQNEEVPLDMIGSAIDSVVSTLKQKGELKTEPAPHPTIKIDDGSRPASKAQEIVFRGTIEYL